MSQVPAPSLEHTASSAGANAQTRTRVGLGRWPASWRASVWPDAAADRAPALLRLALTLASLVFLAAFLLVGIFRLIYPMPLELTTEGAILQQVEALLQGQPLYGPPTLQHVPLIYGPTFFYLAAIPARLLGPGFLPLRLVSLLATCGSLALSYLLVQRETGSRLAGLASAAFLAALGPLTDGALDDGRVDALWLFLVLAGVWSVRAIDGDGFRALGAGLLGGLAFGLALLTKQAALPVIAAVGLYLVLASRRQVVPFALALVASVGLPVLLLSAQSGSWVFFYLWGSPSQHDLNEILFPQFWRNDILPFFTLGLCVFVPLLLVGRWARGHGHAGRQAVLFYGLLLAGLCATSWLTRSNVGGGTNTLLPVYAGLALAFGLGLHEGLRYARGVDLLAVVSASFVLAWALMQLVILNYNPRLMVPYRDELWADARLRATLAALPGPIFAPDFDAVLRGTDKGEQPYSAAAEEITGGYSKQGTPVGDQWKQEVAAALAAHSFNYVVVRKDERFNLFLVNTALGDGYVDGGPLFPPSDSYWLWTGQWELNPEILLAPGAPPPVLPSPNPGVS